MIDLIEIATTLDCQEAAESLGRKLVEVRLAACVQIDGPIQSIYYWNGTLHSDAEWRCTVKSAAYLEEEISQFIQANHPYDVPQILVKRVESASESYRTWVLEQVKTLA